MSVEKLKEDAAIRMERINNKLVGDDEARAHVENQVRETLDFKIRERLPPNVEPAFDWTVILQILLPIILAWIDRRFPPKPIPVPVPVEPK